MSEQRALKLGDVVLLKSGGETMTVVDRFGNSVTVVWLDAKHRLQQAVIHVAALEFWA